MRRIITLAAVAVLLTLSLPAAHAKGPVAVTISGDGVDGSIAVNVIDDPVTGPSVNSLVESLAVFDLVFGESKQVLAKQPTKELGDAVLTLAWDLHGGDEIITQHVYLEAEGGPLTHVPAGQPLWEDVVSAGRWMVVTGDIATPLTEFGVDAAVFKTKIDRSTTKKVPVTKAPEEKAQEKKVLAPEAPAAAATTASAAPAAGPAEAASSSSAVMPVLALFVLAGIIGAAAWMRVRPAAQ